MMRFTLFFLLSLLLITSCKEEEPICETPIQLGTFLLDEETTAYIADAYSSLADIQFENEAGETVTFTQTNRFVGTFEDRIEETCPNISSQSRFLVFNMEDRFFFYQADSDSLFYNIAIGATVFDVSWNRAQTPLTTIDRFGVNLTTSEIFIQDRALGFYSSYREISDPDFKATFDNVEIEELTDYTILDETFSSLITNRDTTIFLAETQGVVGFKNIDGSLWKRIP